MSDGQALSVRETPAPCQSPLEAPTLSASASALTDSPDELEALCTGWLRRSLRSVSILKTGVRCWCVVGGVSINPAQGCSSSRARSSLSASLLCPVKCWLYNCENLSSDPQSHRQPDAGVCTCIPSALKERWEGRREGAGK